MAVISLTSIPPGSRAGCSDAALPERTPTNVVALDAPRSSKTAAGHLPCGRAD
ncbi:hypothetical protein YT1_0230 [Rhodococcus ruber]|nr:hypothetical protein YT1_0230 [Rhodococcus ruber]